MEKIFNLGYIPYNSPNSQNNVTIEMELKTKDNKKVLSICADVWTESKKNIVIGGQCLDELKPYFTNNALFNDIYRLWKLYHLNDMHADCTHQRNNKDFQAQKNEVITVYRWLHLLPEIAKDKQATEEYIKETLQKKGRIKLTKNQQYLYSLKNCCTDIMGNYDTKTYYHKPEDVIYKTANEVYYTKHERGLLLKPCEVCGYQYGSAWLYEEIPAHDLIIIETLLNIKQN